MKHPTAILLLAISLCMACHSPEATHGPAVGDAHTQASSEATPRLILDNGSKWKMNEEMKAPIVAAEKEAGAFSGTTLQDYHQLSARLKTHFDSLISSCTMQGKGHEVLHEWLLPQLKRIDQLQAATDTAAARAVVTEFRHQMATYSEFFE